VSFTVPGGRSDFHEFAFVCYGKDIPDVIRNAVDIQAVAEKVGYATYADRLGRALDTLTRDMEHLGEQMAVLGTLTLRQIERATRVRPEAHRSGHKSLNDSLYARPLAIPGGIGIADFVVLDRDVRWWPTNEFGSNARVGGRLFGTFTGGSGDSPPDPSQFRQHAMFESGDGPDAGLGIITNPIPARHFIEESVKVIDKEWRAKYDAVVGAFNSQLDDLLKEVARQLKAQRAGGLP
jgi:hypothetical protein